MADPKKMAAFLGNFEEAPVQAAPPGVEEPVGAAPAPEDDMGEAEDDFQEFGDGKYGELIPLLEENAEQIEELATALDIENPADVLTEDEHDEDAVDLAMEALDDLGEDFQEAAMVLMEAEPGDFEKLAQHLLVEEMISDDMTVAAFLCLLSYGMRAEADEEEGTDDEDGDEDETEDDEGEEGDEDDEEGDLDEDEPEE